MIPQKTKSLEITQAVLVCDNYKDEFQPIQSEHQLALLKIVNCPLIEYTLSFLKASGIDQVIIFSSNGKKITNYLKEKKWIKEDSEIPFAIVITCETNTSLGHIMREIFNRSLIKKDFILLNGNIIGNLPLLKYLKEHVNRRLNEDKGLIMTMVYTKMNHDHRSRTKEHKSILVINKDTQKLVYYETLDNSKKKLDLNLDLLSSNSSIEIHSNLQDTSIAFCSVEVPLLFADNFDYSDKEDLIKGILVVEEILRNTIYVKKIEEGLYGAKVYDPFSFDAISRDIIQRWSYPSVPDSKAELCYQRHNIYKDSSVVLEADSFLKRNSVIGKNTIIGLRAFIKDSVIGENCKIGIDVKIEGCYLMDNIVIENNCELKKCILSNNVNMKKNCKLLEGCILGNDCIIGPDITLNQCSLLVSKPLKDQVVDKKLVGLEGHCFQYVFKDDDDFSDSDSENEKEKPVLWGPTKNLEEFDDSSSSEDDVSSSTASEQLNDSDDFEEKEELDIDIQNFYNEVLDSLQRGIDEKIDCKNLVLEINCSKHAYNVPIKDLVCLVVKAILDLPKYMDKTIDNEKNYFVKFQKILNQFFFLIQNYVKSKESQIDCLLTLENYCLNNSSVFTVTVLVKVLSIFYDKNVLAEEIILKWHKLCQIFPATLNEVNESERINLRANKLIKDFIEWLLEAEEETSEEEE